MDEFALIRRYFAGTATPDRSRGIALGVGDDCALLRVPDGLELAVTTDTLISGRHFPEDTEPYSVGWKALAVNLSDLAAMGARPRWFTLALSIPAGDAHWLEGFSEGLRALATAHDVHLVGGDTTRGPLSITITAMGLVAPDAALRRDRARPGDVVCVTGSLGDAALALSRLQAGTASAADQDAALRLRLDRPQPRLAAGLGLSRLVQEGISVAAIDLSDGLAGDLGHILEASGCGAELEAEALPASPAFAALRPEPDRALALQLHGGDDYELCLCLAPAALARAHRVLGDDTLTVVGRVTAEAGLFVHRSGRREPLTSRGFDHFSP